MHRVGAHLARQAQLHLLVVTAEDPAVARRIAFVQGDLVLQQFLGMGGHAELVGVIRRHAEQSAHAEQLALDQGFGHGREHLERHIEAFFDGVHHPVVDDHVHFDVRVQARELGQHPAEVTDGEARQHLHAQFAGGFGPQFAHVLGQRVETRDHVGAFLVVRLAYFGEPHMAGAAVEQRRVDELFQLLDAMGDHRASHAQLLGRLGEVAGFGHPHKGFDTE
ncbi:hypothetical protein D3C87_1481680 [compost metagenome]